MEIFKCITVTWIQQLLFSGRDLRVEEALPSLTPLPVSLRLFLPTPLLRSLSFIYEYCDLLHGSPYVRLYSPVTSLTDRL